jgi:hypothetical protein
VAVLRLFLTSLLLLVCAKLWALDLNTVFENTSVTPPARVDFREERHNPMLKEPILLTGYLEYLKPGFLRKVVESPFEESFLITDEYIEIVQGGETRRLSLNKGKSIRAMLDGIEAVLAGQTDKLSTFFKYELSGTEESWSLHLVPRSKRVAAQMSGMLVKGDACAIHSIRIDIREGEWSLLEILDTETAP